MKESLAVYLQQNRPRSFKEILGHERWFEALVSSLKQERMTQSHQPIALIGPPGVGKRTLARMYAKSLICERDLDERIDAAPCGICDECRAMELSSFAYVEKDAIGVRDAGDDGDSDERAIEKSQEEALHTLIERDGGLNTASVRVVVFDSAEEFVGATADIALKTLEQEITSSLYVFLVNNEARFSAALRSRCSVYRVGPISLDDLVGRLSLICERRSVPFDEVALRAIAVAAAGSFGDALAILERVERHGDVTVGCLIQEPEFAWGAKMLACWRAVLGGRRDQALSLFAEVGIDGPMRVRAMQAFLVECRMRRLMDGLPTGMTVSPALDLLPGECWELIMREWEAWSRHGGIGVNEAVERVLGFWTTVKVGAPWKASFGRGYEVFENTGVEMTNGIQ